MLDTLTHIPNFVWTLPLSIILAVILHRSAAREPVSTTDGWTTLSHGGAAKLLSIIGVVLGILLIAYGVETVLGYSGWPDGVIALSCGFLAFIMISSYWAVFRRSLAYKRDGIMAGKGHHSRFIPWAEVSAFKRGFFRGPHLRLKDGEVIKVSPVLIGYNGFVRTLARQHVRGADRELAKTGGDNTGTSADYWLDD
ncbi:hypothetical protein [Kordiimonas gwangyangensis]|uniref:hypothetical protein n=1 Tax=Kordiimonas gwangyangensis TaxID=288022 RepID=UPI00037A084A|nr:hypothetical protein [Kordiimonas gwangyangensis]